MPSKIQTLAALSRETGQRIVSSPEEWQAFLRAAARLYKYPFEEQLLIYAQRPDATACAQIEQWNKSVYRRWVKPGAKGIALIDTTGSYPRLKYVFDAADTRETMYSRPLRLWEYRAEYAQQVSEELQNHFGEVTAEQDFTAQLRGIIENAVEDNLGDYVSALAAVAEGSQFADTDDITMQALLHMAVATSVEYVIFSRLGLSTDHITEDDWLAISLFNTLETAAQLGAAVSDISEMALRQIERTVKSIEKERGTFANLSPVLDNELEKEIERSARYGTDLHTGGKLPHSRTDAGRAAEGAAGQVWDAAQEVFEGTQEENLRGAGAERDAASTSSGNRPDRAGTGGAGYVPDGGGRERDGSLESSRPDGLGGQNEQHQEPGRGNGTERLDIYLTSNQPDEAESAKLPAFSMDESPAPTLPTIQAQLGNIREAQSRQLSLLSVSQQAIDEVLCTAGNEENGNLRICAYVQAGHTDEELAAFMREEYDTGGLGVHTAEGQIAAWWDESGVRVAQGKRARYENSRLLTWEEATRRTRELLELGRYMSADDWQRVNENERKEVAEQLWLLDRDIEGGHLLEETLFRHGFPEDTARIAQELAEPEQREAYLAAVLTLAERYAQDRNVLRFHNHKIGRLMERLDALGRDSIEFTADAPITHTDADYYITEDEIDRMLTGGSGVQDGKYRIYLYLAEQHTASEKAAFLRKEYGIGGFGRKGYDESHDGKGITFSVGAP